MKRFFGIAAFLTCFLFILVACNDEENYGIEKVETDGRLTITGLIDYTGHKIYVVHGDTFPSGDSLNVTAKSIGSSNDVYDLTVADDSITFYVYKTVADRIEGDHTYGKSINYKGNDQNVVFTIYEWLFVNGEKKEHEIGTVTASFTNGIGNGIFIPLP